MDFLDVSNPIIVISSILILIVVLVIWNKYNSTILRKRRSRNFRTNYYTKKKQAKDEDLH